MSQPTYSIPSREAILSVLRTAPAALLLDEIAQTLSVSHPAQEGLTRRIEAMERDGQIQQDTRGAYQAVTTNHFIAGHVQGHRDGYGFLIRKDGQDDLFLTYLEMRKALHGDQVLAKIVGYDKRGRPEGRIVEVIERANQLIAGRLLNENGVLLVSPEDKRIGQDIVIPPGAQGKAKVGQIVTVALTEFPSRHAQPQGKVIEILGDLADPGIEIDIAVRKHGVPYRFSDAALAQANGLPQAVCNEDLLGRIDLRDLPLVTIDGEDARDFDDAVYCEPLKLGRTIGFRLIVAIADVSHYVKPYDALDHEALARSTSVYFPRRVIPMLPEKLSNGLCSLNPAVDRCVLVCDLVVDAQGALKAYQFYPAVIHSAARLTYTEVAALLADPTSAQATGAGKQLLQLAHLQGVYEALRIERQVRGAVDFDTVETQIICNTQGKIEHILPRERNVAHKLIEECMLAANVCAADFLRRNEQLALYRVHAGPTEEKLANLRSFLGGLGLTLGGGLTPSTRDYAVVMAKIRKRPDAPLLQSMVLRSMQQAVYSPENIGHFGLAYEAYAHFTSPIRRYPDLLTHRAIRAILAGQRYAPDPEIINQLDSVPLSHKRHIVSVAATPRAQPEAANAVWEALGLHCSLNERRADEASRDVEAWLKCYFMRDKLGQTHPGVISGVTPFGIFVQLEELFIEGLVHITGLGTDYFQYDEVHHLLRGERTGVRYRLFDRVLVQVSRVDLDARKIDFCLVGDHVSPSPDSATQHTGPKKERKRSSRKKTAVAQKAHA